MGDTTTSGTPTIISSNHIDELAVVDPDGTKVGTIASIFFDPASGQAVYIVVLSGAVLGIGGSYHPLPWRLVRYAPSHGGYVLTVEKSVLTGGPSFKSAGDARFDPAYVSRIDSYYATAR